MAFIVVNRLAELKAGDRLISRNVLTYRTSLLVTVPLGPLKPDHPVRGVRLQNHDPVSAIEWVFYPAQLDGRALEVERP